MLIEFKVKNYRSFKDETVLSMVASPDKSLPDNVIEPKSETFKHRLLKSAVIYGANASGKSNIIKAMVFMRMFANSSTAGDASTPINLQPFLFDSDCVNAPSLFEVNFLIDGIRHEYGFSADREKIHSEWLYTYPRGKQTRIFERNLDENNISQYSFNKAYNKRLKEIQTLTRPNSLLLTVAAQFNMEFAKNILMWFFNSVNISLDAFSSDPFLTAYMSLKDNETKKHFLDLMDRADLGISDFKIDEAETEKQSQNLRTKIATGTETSLEDYQLDKPIEFIHEIRTANNNEHRVTMDFKDESDGTKKVFSLLGPLVTTIKTNSRWFADELDTRLHPALSEWFVDVWHKYRKDSGAQLIFTTHNAELLDPEIFRRDQIWFTEKDHKSGASRIYSLLDYKARKDENFRANYLGGRYGAVPVLMKFRNS